jgi:hypothetical protein
MTLLERLQTHKGSLLHLKTELFWYGVGWDRNPGRICLILDATTSRSTSGIAAATATGAGARIAGTAGALVLIDGSPQWIWVADKDVEVLNDPA